MLEPAGGDSRIPVPSTPGVEIEVGAAFGREEERRVESWRELFQRLQDALPKRHATERAVLLAVELELAIGEHTTDVNDLLPSIDVTPFECDPFLRPKTCSGDEDRDRTEGREEFT